MFYNAVIGTGIAVPVKIFVLCLFMFNSSMMNELYAQSPEIRMIGSENGVFTYAIYFATDEDSPRNLLDFTISTDNPDLGECVEFSVASSWLGAAGDIAASCSGSAGGGVRIRMIRQDGQLVFGEGVVAIVVLEGGGAVMVDNVDL